MLKGYEAYKKIKYAMKAIIHETLIKKEHDDKWGFLLKEFEFGENEWLRELYKNRHRWVPIFLKKEFWVDISIM